MGKLVNIKQLSEFLGVCKRTVYRMVEDGQIPKGIRHRCLSPQWDIDEIVACIEKSPWTPTPFNVPAKDESYLSELMGSPKITMSGAQYKANNRPLVYAWVRDKRILYVGMSTKGIGRPLTPGHERIKNMEADDTLLIWFVESAQKAIELEAFLLRNIKPIYNFTGTGRPVGKKYESVTPSVALVSIAEA